jgi:pyruvate-formate lyase
MEGLKELQYALQFTETYKEYSNGSKEIREVKCLELQIEHILQSIQADDLVAGFMKHGFVGFSSQYGGIYTYFFHKDKVQKALEESVNSMDESFISKVNQMVEFWEEENTLKKLQNTFKADYGFILSSSYTEPGIANADARVAGTNVDMDKLITLGLPGLKDEIRKYKESNEGSNFYDGLETWVDLVAKACYVYEKNVEQLLETEKNNERMAQLKDMLHTLKNIQFSKPESFKEALQLFWIYAVISDIMNYGRMDVFLGDLFCTDIDSGAMSEEEGIEYLSSLWRQFIRVGKIHDCRVIIGGAGRRNEKNADRLAIAIMEVSRRMKEVVPQLTLRYYTGMNEKVFEKALSVIGEGYCYPIIYSDDTNIPAVMKGYDVSREEAERYLPFGCGEYVLEGLSTGTPNNGINLLKALELVLHDGYDPVWKMQLEESFGGIEKLDTFEKLFEQYCRYVERNSELAAVYKKMNYDVAGQEAAYLHLSLLMNDCIKRGKPILEGGVKYLNASSEVFGMISCADSMTAIKKLVYEDKRFTIKQVVEMLDSNFVGYEKERKIFLNAPKYGNDNNYADEIVQLVYNHMADTTMEMGRKVGLNKYLMVSVNNSMSAEWGLYCAASACGRKYKDPMANANGASIGADKSGLTSLLNSMSKFDNSKHVGVINNVRFTKEMFKTSYDKLKYLILSFLKNNGVQLNLCCIGKDDLENALVEPDKYRNLVVRIGGFSARFVELSAVVQNEIIKRTTYEGQYE